MKAPRRVLISLWGLFHCLGSPRLIEIDHTLKIKKEVPIMATRRSMWILFWMLIFSAWALGAVIHARAETMKCRVVNQFIYREMIPVGDAEEHMLGLFSRKGLASFESGEVATWTNWGTQDVVKGTGPFHAYQKYIFEDGSTIVGRMQGMTLPGSGKALALIEATGDFISGTGRFVGIKGTLTVNGKVLTPYGKDTKSDLYLDIVMTYTLPPK
jgi:hypothetical protein